MEFGGKGQKKITKAFEGLVPQMQRLYEQTESEFTRNRIRAFMTRETCKICGGARLKPEILAVTIKARPGSAEAMAGQPGAQIKHPSVQPANRGRRAAICWRPRPDGATADHRSRRCPRDSVPSAIPRRSWARLSHIES